MRSDLFHRRRIREVGHVVIGERPGCNGQRAIDRIATGMTADRVAMIRFRKVAITGPRSLAVGAPHTICGRSVMVSIGDPFAGTE